MSFDNQAAHLSMRRPSRSYIMTKAIYGWADLEKVPRSHGAIEFTLSLPDKQDARFPCSPTSLDANPESNLGAGKAMLHG